MKEKNRNKDTKRDNGIDALRVVAMSMVIMVHILNFGMNCDFEIFTFSWSIGWILKGYCYCAVNIYAMVSGYVMVNHRPKIERLINLWFQVFFYSVLSLILLLLIKPDTVGKIDMLKSFFPVCGQIFWYFTAYFALFWFMPFLNRIVHNLEFKQFQYLIGMLLTIFGFMPWMAGTFWGAPTFGVSNGYSVLWIAILYLVGAGIRLYGFDLLSVRNRIYSKKFFLNMALLSGGAIFGSKVLFTIITLHIFGKEILTNLFYSYLSPLVVLEAVFLLCFFSNIRIKGKWTRFGKTTFGIYIIQMTPFFSNIVWKLFENYTNGSVLGIIGVIIEGTVVIFVGCAIVEHIRTKFFSICKIDQFSIRVARKINWEI